MMLGTSAVCSDIELNCLHQDVRLPILQDFARMTAMAVNGDDIIAGAAKSAQAAKLKAKAHEASLSEGEDGMRSDAA